MDGIKELLDKISSYNIFNYLLPGILFVAICKYSVGLDLILENNFLGAFVYYFLGMIISRIGSLAIGPVLEKIRFIKKTEYKRFVQASKNDAKIDILSEQNNTYRTLLSMTVILLLLKCYKHYNYYYWHITHDKSYLFLLCGLIVLFLFSYRKQTNFITKRIDANL